MVEIGRIIAIDLNILMSSRNPISWLSLMMNFVMHCININYAVSSFIVQYIINVNEHFNRGQFIVIIISM